MKKLLTTLLIVLTTHVSNAQEKGKFRVNVDCSVDNMVLKTFTNKVVVGVDDLTKPETYINAVTRSIALSVDYNLTDNTNIGLKYLNPTFYFFDQQNYHRLAIPAMLDASSLLIDYTYYFRPKGWKVSPFVELGGGVLYFPTTNFESGESITPISYNWYSSVFPRYTFAESLSVGVENKHFRFTLEYLCSLPTTKINVQTGYGRNMLSGTPYISPGTTSSMNLFLSRISLRVGFFIGGGSLKK